MEPQIAFFAVFVCGMLGVVAWQWWHSPEQVARRKLRAVEAAPIGGLRPGQRVKVTGRVALRKALESPLQGRSCAYWAALVEEKAGKNSWRTVADRWEGVPFWIEDPTGRVHVDPGLAKLALGTSRIGGSGTFDDPGPREAAALEQFGLSGTGLLGMNRHLRYSEASIDDGELVSVIGEVAVVEVDGEPALALVAMEEELVVSDAHDVHG